MTDLAVMPPPTPIQHVVARPTPLHVIACPHSSIAHPSAHFCSVPALLDDASIVSPFDILNDHGSWARCPLSGFTGYATCHATNPYHIMESQG